jgi:DNA (cytosine-5)-methyltransferase 1
MTELNKLSKKELVIKCKELSIKGYSNKNKDDLIKLINNNIHSTSITLDNIYYDDDEKSNNNTLKYIDLFCGIGSFHYSFKKLGWKCVMACDLDNAAKNTYYNNYGLSPLDDITNIKPCDIPMYDILCAGFPCQPFSLCGKHEGFNDNRGTLFFNIMKFVQYHKPKIIILENVQGLLNHDKGNTFTIIKNEIQNLDYSITYKILKCSDYGIPQMRKRLFIIGVRNDDHIINNINNILELDEYKKDVSLKDFLHKNFEKKVSYTIRCGGKNSPINDKHNWDGYIIDGNEYRLTIQDCLKLQGFDNNFKLYGTLKEQWKLLGNTIPTIFTKIIGENIKKYI